MLPPTKGRRWSVFFLLPILVAIAAPVCGQRLGRIETRDQLRNATRELGRRNRLDPATEERLRRSLATGFDSAVDSEADMRRAERSVAEALKARKFGLAFD